MSKKQISILITIITGVAAAVLGVLISQEILTLNKIALLILVCLNTSIAVFVRYIDELLGLK